MSPKLPHARFNLASAKNMTSSYQALDRIGSLYSEAVVETEPCNSNSQFVTLREFKEQAREVFLLRE